MNKYRKYKKSKFKWFTEIPIDWKEGRISYLFNIGRGRVISELELNPDGKYPVYSSQTKNDGCLGYIDTYDFDANILTWTTDGANAGSVFIREGKFNCTNVCGTLSPKTKVELKYYLYYLQAITTFYKRPDTNGAKIMNNEMAAIYSLIPSLSEQTQIAYFLDHKVGIIDDLIKRKEKLIELLYEKRQDVIFNLATKGLNRNVDLKKSNTLWWGNIPSDWDIKRIKFLFKIKKEIAGKLGYEVLSVTQRGIKIRDLDNLKGQLSMDYSKYQIVEKGEFIMNHMDLLTGYIDISKYDGVTSPDYRVFRAKSNEVCTEYYLFIFQFCYHNKIFFGLGQGVSDLGRWRMPSENFNNFPIPVPPYTEQIEIASKIKETILMMEQYIEKERNIIEKLKEYRQSIISEAVTGKIDVRDWQPKKQVVA